MTNDEIKAMIIGMAQKVDVGGGVNGMNYYYVIKNDNTIYTIRRKKPITDKSMLNDKKAKYIVPITLLQYIYMSLKFSANKI